MTEKHPRALYGLPAPAKLNLFLHVIGRRDDGKHLLESVFVLIDLQDTIDLEYLAEDVIERTGDIVGDVENDLCVRAAALIKERYAIKGGVRIRVTKRIPSGAGMGGGSSDAATTLLGMVRLFNLSITRAELMALGETLGADVPFFIFGQSGFVQGIGEIITPVPVPPTRFRIIWPGVSLSTAKIFSSDLLTRDTKSAKIAVFSTAVNEKWPEIFGHNDLQQVAVMLEPRVKIALEMLADCKSCRMTGSGSAVFGIISTDRENSCSLGHELPRGWREFISETLPYHPLATWLNN